MALLQHTTNHKWLNVLIVTVFSVALIIPIRGGFQLAPINQSSVYFSNHNFANHATVNASWNFLHGVMNKTSATHNPYSFLPAKSKLIVDSLYNGSGSLNRYRILKAQM